MVIVVNVTSMSHFVSAVASDVASDVSIVVFGLTSDVSYWVQNHSIHLVCGDGIRTPDLLIFSFPQ